MYNGFKVNFDVIFSTQDKYKRALAETENVRTRYKRQLDDSKLYSIQGFCKDLLEVSDVLDIATKSVPDEELKGGNKHLKSLYQGLQMTGTQLQTVGLVKQIMVELRLIKARFVPPVNVVRFLTSRHRAVFAVNEHKSTDL